MPHLLSAPPVAPYRPARTALCTLLAFLCLLAWDAAGQDLALAQVFGNSHGFPLREHWFLVYGLHEGPRRLAWLLTLALTLAIWWPFGVLRRVGHAERLQLAITTLLSLAVVTALKYTSTTSCPWSLAQFGGVARHVSHWALGTLDGGGGRCFPAGHAAAGFSFLGGYFALRRLHPRQAHAWLAAALASGLVLGWAQQMRGAHFLSHTLWTGWLCWTTAWVCDLVSQRLQHLPRRARSTPLTKDSPHAAT
ncbi:phosphatidic acid phosphatase [Acidovorax sp. SRB_14]|uniref:phosphatase PAP2 family protein n=1 Tax=Acidovorax sp. SRB_14 TaxID=1962699 RepID=UPI00156491BE|nr:phosphatase PAP2 family protein [Acidovorax sp. SRB_14]NMM81936.1 phosphatidic acid phosphatase [Acidovorax sp. SRB_14]